MKRIDQSRSGMEGCILLQKDGNMRLYIVRHGETPWNAMLRLQGQTDTRLNEKGRALARLTGAALQEVPFDLVVSSPLHRARETAEIILGERKIPILEDARIREIGFGELEGKQLSKEEKNDPCSEFYCFFHDPAHYIPPEGGETVASLIERTRAFLDELKERKEWKDKTILVSSHGAAVRALLAAIKGFSPKDFWQNGVPKNCAVSIVDLEDGAWIIKEQDVVYYENV